MRQILAVPMLVYAITGHAAGGFDGRYSGVGTVTVGNCPAFTIAVTISDDRISGYAQSPRRRVAVVGRVGPNGEFESLALTGYADGAGKIAGDRITGNWRNAEEGCEGSLLLTRER